MSDGSVVTVVEDGSVVCRECGAEIERGDVSTATAHAVVHRTETVEEATG